jgi:hypothetical protein
MTLILETSTPLTEDQVRQVKTFAEFLAHQNAVPVATQVVKLKNDDADSPVNADALLGLCKNMGGHKTDKQLKREAWNHLAAKYDD